MVMAMAGVASAANKIGVGYGFMEDERALCLVGELDLSDALGFGFDYAGWEPNGVTEVYARLSLTGLGLSGAGVFGGVKLVSGADEYTYKVGVFAEQEITPEIIVYGRAGMAFQSAADASWVEAQGGMKAAIMAPFWIGGEAVYVGEGTGAGTTFRVLVGIDF